MTDRAVSVLPALPAVTGNEIIEVSRDGQSFKMTAAQFATLLGGQLPGLLPSGDIFVGNGANAATAVALSGDATLSNAGAITVTKFNGGTALGSAAGHPSTDFLSSGHDAQVAVAGAAASAKPNVKVTSEALVAQTEYTLTLTDALIAATSIVHVTAFNGVATGVLVRNITPGAGSVVIVLDFVAYSGALTILVSIFN